MVKEDRNSLGGSVVVVLVLAPGVVVAPRPPPSDRIHSNRRYVYPSEFVLFYVRQREAQGQNRVLMAGMTFTLDVVCHGDLLFDM